MNHPILSDISQKLENLTNMVKEIKSGNRAYLTLEDAAEYLGISKSTLYKHTSSGDIAFNKPNGKLILFNRTDLDSWINRNRIPANHEL